MGACAVRVARPVLANVLCLQCDCGKGLAEMTVWPGSDKSQSITVKPDGGMNWLLWDSPVSEIGWKCDGMDQDQRSKFGKPVQWFSVQHTVEAKGERCKKDSGRLRFVAWEQAGYNTSLPFASTEGGYFCIKIPVLLFTAKGSLLAIGEARKFSCSDFAWTDLVVKRSEDLGRTWSGMRVIRSASGPGLPPTVIGNAAPVQLAADSAHHPNRILLPHSRNNSDVWVTHSDDDGLTWANATLVPPANSTDPSWQWVATGPPGSIQLRGGGAGGAAAGLAGRVVVPGYHGPNRGNLANNKVEVYGC